MTITELDLVWTGANLHGHVQPRHDQSPVQLQAPWHDISTDARCCWDWNRGFFLRGVLRIQVSVQILILLIFYSSHFYSSQFILLIFYSCKHLQSAGVCCNFCDCIFSQKCDSVTSALFQETEIWVCACFIVLCSSWSLPWSLCQVVSLLLSVFQETESLCQ